MGFHKTALGMSLWFTCPIPVWVLSQCPACRILCRMYGMGLRSTGDQEAENTISHSPGTSLKRVTPCSPGLAWQRWTHHKAQAETWGFGAEAVGCEELSYRMDPQRGGPETCASVKETTACNSCKDQLLQISTISF